MSKCKVICSSKGKNVLITFPGLCRSADHDCGPGGLWEILAAVSHAGRDAESQWKSPLEQVRES